MRTENHKRFWVRHIKQKNNAKSLADFSFQSVRCMANCQLHKGPFYNAPKLAQGIFMGLWMIKGFLANINMKAKNKVKGSHVVRCRTAPCVVDNWPYILQTEKKNRPKIFTFFFFRCGSPKSARGFLYACRLKFCTQNETIYTNNHIKQSKNPNHWNYITPFKSDIQ